MRALKIIKYLMSEEEVEYPFPGQGSNSLKAHYKFNTGSHLTEFTGQNPDFTQVSATIQSAGVFDEATQCTVAAGVGSKLLTGSSADFAETSLAMGLGVCFLFKLVLFSGVGFSAVVVGNADSQFKVVISQFNRLAVVCSGVTLYGPSLSLGVWYLVRAWRTPGGLTVNLIINNNAKVTSAGSSLSTSAESELQVGDKSLGFGHSATFAVDNLTVYKGADIESLIEDSRHWNDGNFLEYSPAA